MKRSRRWALLFAVMVAVAWCGTPLAAETKPTAPTAPAKTAPKTAPEEIPDADPAKVQELAAAAGIAPEKVAAMRTSGLGWGEVKVAITMAQKVAATPPVPPATAVTVDQALDNILASRQEGMGWGQVAQANGFKLGSVIGKGSEKRAEGAGVKANKPDAVSRPEKPEKPEKPARPDKPERPEKPERPVK